jgi:hypothetical protein
MLRNLWTALKLSLLLVPADTKNIRNDDKALWFTVLALFASYLYYSWIYLGRPYAGFDWGGFLPLGFLTALVFLGAFLLGFILRAPQERVRKITILFMNVNIWITFFSYSLFILLLDRMKEDDARNLWNSAFALWNFIVFYKIVLLESEGAGWRELAGALLFTAIFNAAFISYEAPRFLHGKYEREYSASLVAEDVFGRQPSLLDKAFAAIKPSRPGQRDSYLIAAGVDAYQDVFRKEALFAQKSFDKNARTAGRSLVLVNSTKTARNLPVANLTNLEAALRRMGAMIQPDEDALILYLTSHGSDNATLETYLPDVSLYDINGPDLREILDRSRFKWRIIIIAACYSGSFIKPLQNDNTIIITASAADRNSFGCSDTASLTYFGEAFLKDALPGARSWPEAFKKAQELVTAREKADGFKPSLPQMVIGKNIKDVARIR